MRISFHYDGPSALVGFAGAYAFMNWVPGKPGNLLHAMVGIVLAVVCLFRLGEKGDG